MNINPHSICLYPTVKLLKQMGLLKKLQVGLNPLEVPFLEKSQNQLLQKIFDYLLNMNFLEKNNDQYHLRNSVEVNAYLDIMNNRDISEIFEKLNNIFINNQKPDLKLKKFDPVNKDFFYSSESTPEVLDNFLFPKAYDDGVRLSQDWQFPKNARFVDLGGGGGGFALALVKKRSDVEGIVFDLAAVETVFRKRKAANLQENVKFKDGDIFEGEIPSADFYFLRLVLHDFSDIPQRQILANICRQMPNMSTLVIGERMIDLPLSSDRTTASIEDLVLSTEAYLNSNVGTEYKFKDFEEQLWQEGFYIEKIIRQDVNYFFCKKRESNPKCQKLPEKTTDIVCEISASEWTYIKIDRDQLGNIFEIYFTNKAGTKKKKFEFVNADRLSLRYFLGRILTLCFIDYQNFDGINRFGFLISHLKVRFPFLIYQSEPVQFKIQPDCSWSLVNKNGVKIQKV